MNSLKNSVDRFAAFCGEMSEDDVLMQRLSDEIAASGLPDSAAFIALQFRMHELYISRQTSIIDLEAERFQWSLATFPEATAISSLRKCESEIMEIEADIHQGKPNPEEYADALMCLFDSAGRSGIPVSDIFQAFEEKLKINKARVWKKNPDNSYSHVK